MTADPWDGFDFTARPKPESTLPAGAKHLSAATDAGVRRQAEDQGLELVTDITYDQGDYRCHAYAVPITSSKDES
jgi:hypothetical protein